jgi:large subunit ribosomal protein L24
MQKVIRRTILAEKQAVRRAAKRNEKKQREWRKNTLEQGRFQKRDEVGQIKAARLARKEDWELGPLAPKRDVGLQQETYGTINTLRSKGPVLTKKARWDQRLYIGGKYPTIVVDDRVVITEGRDKGKIGVVTEMDFSRGECKVEGLNMVCLPLSRPFELRTKLME